MANAPVLRADPLPAHAARVVDYSIDVRLDAAAKTLYRPRAPHVDQPVDRPGARPLVPSVSERVPQQSRRRSSANRAGSCATRRCPRTAGAGPTSHRCGSRMAPTCSLTRHLRASGRREHGRPDRAARPAAVARGAGRVRHPRHHVDGEATEGVRANRVLGRLLPRGSVVPKIAVYEPAGVRGRTVGGWNCHQFHANSEFYADFGRFAVDITVPSAFVVGATGRRVWSAAGPRGTTRYRYEQEDVHDFAWTADPRFIEFTDRFSATRDVTPPEYTTAAAELGRSIEDVRLADVDIRLLHAAGPRAPGATISGRGKGVHQVLRALVRAVSLRDPDDRGPGDRCGGVRRDGVPRRSSREARPRSSTGGPSTRCARPEIVTAHEFAHQFWYGLVASNEFEEAWLDEGITSYSTGRILDTLFGPSVSVAALPGLHLGEEDLIRVQNSPRRIFDRVRANAWNYSPDMYRVLRRTPSRSSCFARSSIISVRPRWRA